MGNLHDLLMFLVDKYNHIIDKDTLRIQFESDPSKNFQTLSNTCDYFDIENFSLLLPKNTFEKLPNYFIAEIKNERQQRLILIDKTAEDELKYSKDALQFNTISKADFLKEWSGVVFAIEQSTEKRSVVEKLSDYKEYFFATTSIILILVIMTLKGFVNREITSPEVLEGNYKLEAFSIVFFLISGILASFHLIKQKYEGKGNSFICKLGKSSDCNQVINSKQAKLFDKIELTDLCFLAFGSFLISFIIAGQLSFIQLLSLGGLAILPYSLYVQGFVLKKWCPLCFVISVSLVGIAVSGFWNPDLFEFSTLSIAPLLFGVLTSSLVLNLLKEVYKNRGQLFQQKLQYKTLWRSYGVVSNLLDSFQPVELVCDPEKVSLTIVTNPLCPACKRLHDMIKRLEQEFGNAIITSYKFLVNPEDPERPAVKISATILGQSHTDQKTALDEWYDTTDRKNWFKKWHEKADDNHYGLSKLQNQLDWAYTNDINYSPALIIDGRLVPSDYTLDQYKDLIKVFQNKRKSHLQKTVAQQNSFLQDDGQLGVALS